MITLPTKRSVNNNPQKIRLMIEHTNPTVLRLPRLGLPVVDSNASEKWKYAVGKKIRPDQWILRRNRRSDSWLVTVRKASAPKITTIHNNRNVNEIVTRS